MDEEAPEGNVADVLSGLGLPDEAVRRAVDRGRPEDAIFESVLLPEIEERKLSAADVVARGGGPDMEEIRTFWEAFGLPITDEDEPRFTEEEARVFEELHDMQDVWPLEVGVQVARVYGRLLARIAQTEVQLFRVYVEPRLRDAEDPLAALVATRDAFARLLPSSGALLLGVHRRWVEHHIAQEIVNAAETSAGTLPGEVSVSFLFCDLKDFTAFAQRRGDQAAVAAIDHFASVITRERGTEVRFTKALGDGYMLVYAEAETALQVGRRVIEEMRLADSPGVHASAHTGTAIAREGDYFGGSVNLAARLLNAAEEDELVATRATADAAGDEFGWDPAGAVSVRGMAEPVEVFRLI